MGSPGGYRRATKPLSSHVSVVLVALRMLSVARGDGHQKPLGRPAGCRFEVLEKYKPAPTVKVRPPE